MGLLAVLFVRLRVYLPRDFSAGTHTHCVQHLSWLLCIAHIEFGLLGNPYEHEACAACFSMGNKILCLLPKGLNFCQHRKLWQAKLLACKQIPDPLQFLTKTCLSPVSWMWKTRAPGISLKKKKREEKHFINCKLAICYFWFLVDFANWMHWEWIAHM